MEGTKSELLCSVICTTYNHIDYCEAAIESIANQSYQNLEVVVVDDGSTDGTNEAVRRALTNRNMRHVLIEQSNTGNVAKNANRAIRNSTGQVLVFMSLDDLLLPNCIQQKLDCLAAEKETVLVINATYAEIDAMGRVLCRRRELPIMSQRGVSALGALNIEYESIGSYFLQGTAVRRHVMHAVGGFDEEMSGDDLILRTRIWKYLIGAKDEKFQILPISGFAYRKRAHGLHQDRLRQVLTVLEWKSLFFPGRPLPKVARMWIWRLMTELIEENDGQRLQETLSMHPVLGEEYRTYRRTWTHVRRRLKGQIAKLIFGVSFKNKHRGK